MFQGWYIIYMNGEEILAQVLNSTENFVYLNIYPSQEILVIQKTSIQMARYLSDDNELEKIKREIDKQIKEQKKLEKLQKELLKKLENEKKN